MFYLCSKTKRYRVLSEWNGRSCLDLNVLIESGTKRIPTRVFEFIFPLVEHKLLLLWENGCSHNIMHVISVCYLVRRMNKVYREDDARKFYWDDDHLVAQKYFMKISISNLACQTIRIISRVWESLIWNIFRI